MRSSLNVMKVVVVFCFLLLFVSYFFNRYTFLPDMQKGVHSTPYKFFVVDKWSKGYEKNDLVVFKAERGEPVIPEGRLVVKFVKGLEGDQVVISGGKVSINGSLLDPIPLQQAKYFNKKLSDFDASYQIPESSFFAMGTHLRSYDSRYWGPVFDDQVVGLAYPIF